MKYLSRIFVSIPIVFAVEEIYFNYHMANYYHTGTVWSGIIVPSVIILALFVLCNALFNCFSSLRCPLHLGILTTLPSALLGILFQFIRPIEDPSALLGKSYANLLVSMAVLGGILLMCLLGYIFARKS